MRRAPSHPAALAAASLALLLAAGGAALPRQDTPGEAERVVQEQLEAYNRRDLDAFLATYHPQVQLYQLPGAEPTAAGLDALREQYGALFEKFPDNRATVTTRIVQGDYVIDHERVARAGQEFSAAAIYRVEAGKIRQVWFAR